MTFIFRKILGHLFPGGGETQVYKFLIIISKLTKFRGVN